MEMVEVVVWKGRSCEEIVEEVLWKGRSFREEVLVWKFV
jgi:hypothetical protein